MRKGFTLLELIVVIIIVGILATLGFVQYTQVIEKGRKAEAKSNLGMLRQLQLVYYQETGVYGVLASGTDNFNSALPITGACNTSYYFGYACTGGTDGSCTATRCSAAGKTPNASTVYAITLSPAGAFTGDFY